MSSSTELSNSLPAKLVQTCGVYGLGIRGIAPAIPRLNFGRNPANLSLKTGTDEMAAL
jgi:hypothetical protein